MNNEIIENNQVKKNISVTESESESEIRKREWIRSLLTEVNPRRTTSLKDMAIYIETINLSKEKNNG